MSSFDPALARRRARAAERAVAGATGDELAGALREAAEANAAASQHGKACGAWERLLALRSGAPPLERAEILLRLGQAYSGYRQQHRRARAPLEEALHLAESALGTDAAALAPFVLARGIALGCGAPRKLEAARDHYARALRLLEAAHGSVHVSLFEPLEMLADVEWVLGQHAAARAHFERGVDLARQLTALGTGAALTSAPEGFGRALALVHRYALHLVPETAERRSWESRVNAIAAAPTLEERLRVWAAPIG